MRNNFQPVRIDYAGGEKNPVSFSIKIIDNHKKYLVGRKEIYPIFFGRTKNGAWAIVFDKQIDTEDDMYEIVGMIKDFFSRGEASEVLLICGGCKMENDKKQEILLCMLFDKSSKMSLKTIDIYRTEDRDICGFSEGEFSSCDMVDVTDYGVLKGSFREN